MRFSVVCTNFNKEKYLGACLDSLLQQSFQDFEFIIIDDCSTDQSVAIIESYATKFGQRFQFIKHTQNLGMAASYNQAIEIAQGEILCLLDSDDFWFSQKLEWVNRAFNLNQDIVMLQHPLQIFDQFDATEEYYRPYLLSGDLMQYARDTKEIPLFVATTGLSFKMDIAKKVLPIPLNFHNNGEAFLTRTVMCFGKTEALAIPLGGYRRTGTNVVFGNQAWDAYEYIETVLKPGLNNFYAKHQLNVYFAPVVKQKHRFRVIGKVKAIAKRLKK